ncbi:MAG: type VI secretion system-associated protein TagF [Rhodanobacter sp.]
MTGELTLNISYFGKLPSRGDFLKAPSNNHQLIAMLDRWAGQSLEQLSQDASWKQLYDMGQPLNFAILGSRSRGAIAGHLLPSTDASGRRFPFMTAVSMDVPQPLAFLSRSPLAFSRVWARMEREALIAHDSTDPVAPLADLADNRANVNVLYESLNPAFQDFLEMQTLESLQSLLTVHEESISVRRILLAMGILLQPVMSSGAARIGKGLLLPLPRDPLYRNLVSTLWLDLISSFLARADFELLVLLRHGPQPTLAVSFNGIQGRVLQAMFDSRIADQDFIPLHDPDWVEDHAHDDPLLKKLSAYASQDSLSLRTARNTFRETFLGA